MRASRSKEEAFQAKDIAPVIRDTFRTRIMERGNVGQQSANSIYLELAQAVVGRANTKPEVNSKNEMLETIKRLAGETERAAAIGAIPHVPFPAFLSTIEQATEENIGALSQVLSPFLTGLEARIDAIKPDVERMHSFLDELNRFYTGKNFHFSMSLGFFIRGTTGSTHQDIPIDWLSSGERQLFTILASVFLTQQASGIVLIDEPELSLNTLWQREFVRALQRIGAGASVQYILATHSLEIMARQEARVISLTPEIKGDTPAATRQ